MNQITKLGAAILALTALSASKKTQTDFSPPPATPPVNESSMPARTLRETRSAYPLALAQEPQRVQNEDQQKREVVDLIDDLKFFKYKRDANKISLEIEDKNRIKEHLVKIDEEDAEVAEKLVKTIEKLADIFNHAVSDVKQIELNNLPEPQPVPEDLNILRDPKVREKYGILRPTKRSYINSLETFYEVTQNQDGSIYPLSILESWNTMTAHGYPTIIKVPNGMKIDPKGIKQVWYMEPRRGFVTKGIYFEIVEKYGNLGPGGINGIIVPSKDVPPVVILFEKEAYFIGFGNLEKDGKSIKPIQLQPRDEGVPSRFQPQPKNKKSEPAFPQTRVG